MKDAVRELFFRGAAAFDAGDYTAATAAFQQIVDRADVADDDKAMACTNLATVRDRSNDVDQALIWYDRALAFAVERRQLVEENRAMYLASKARYAEAIDGLTRLLQATELKPADRLRVEHNLAEAQSGRFAAPAKDAVRELFSRGAAAFDAGDYTAATAAFQQIVDRADVADDDKAMACTNLATVCDRSNDVDQALTWYDRALAFAVDRRQLVEENRAMYLASKAHYTEAIDGLTRLLQAADLKPADRLRLESNLAEAQRERYSPPVDPVYELFVGGLKAVKAGDYAAAAAAFQQIVDRADVADDVKAVACTNLATVCDCSNDVDQALTWYDRARAFAVERRQFVEERRAEYLASKARYSEAIDILTRLLQAPDLEPADRLRLEHNLAEAQRGRYPSDWRLENMPTTSPRWLTSLLSLSRELVDQIRRR